MYTVAAYDLKKIWRFFSLLFIQIFVVISEGTTRCVKFYNYWLLAV